MKATCEKCRRTVEGPGQNLFALCEGRAGWVPFMDAGDGLEIKALCPDHSGPLVEAARLLDGLFGRRATAVHLGGILDYAPGGRAGRERGG